MRIAGSSDRHGRPDRAAAKSHSHAASDGQYVIDAEQNGHQSPVHCPGSHGLASQTGTESQHCCHKVRQLMLWMRAFLKAVRYIQITPSEGLEVG